MGWNFTITEEMRAMGLSGNDLIVYALINTCTLKGNGCYFGGMASLCDACGISRRTAFNVLNDLVERGLLIKGEMFRNGVKFTTYQTSVISAPEVQIMHSGSAENAPININNNINNNSLYKGQPRFVKPSVEEIEQYCSERNNNVDAETFFNFYEAKGWIVGKTPMKDWRAAVRTWEKRQPSSLPASSGYKKESVYEHNQRVMKELLGYDA